MDIIKLTEKTNKLISNITEKFPIENNKYSLITDLMVIKENAGVEKESDLISILNNADNEAKDLKIGIIGRVKAGKSSLLNALLFNGKSILPKAATPMTAALTIMKYGKEVSAELDFFTDEDIKELESKYFACQRYYDEVLESEREKLLKRPKFGVNIEELASNNAHRLLRDHPDYGAYDQYERIKKVSRPTLTQGQKITANSMQDLASKLKDYIGADGKYMPFTKSVTLTIPDEGLKGLEVIDTPGLNDPVASRGLRTEDELAKCDVVLIVSPSGQLLSNEDVALLSRVTTKKGIRECFVVASQIDSALFSTEAQNFSSPEELLANVMEILKKSTAKTFASIRANNPEMSSVLDSFQKNDIIYTSSIADSLYQQFDNQAQWDADQNHIWNNLKEEYPRVFNDSSRAKEVLEKLGNISSVRAILDDVRSRKEEIKEKKKQDAINVQANALKEYIIQSKKYFRDKIGYIQNANIDDVKSQLSQFMTLRDDIIYYENEAYKGLIQLIAVKLKRELTEKLSEAIRKFRKPTAENRSELYTDRVWEEGFLGGFRRFFGGSGGEWREVTRTRNYRAVYASQVRSQLLEIINLLERELNAAQINYFGIQLERTGWKYKILPYELTFALQQALDEHPEIENYEFDRKVLQRAIDAVRNEIIIEDFKLNRSLPSNVDKTGELRNSEGDNFLDAVSNYISNLESSRIEEINTKVTDIVFKLQAVNVAERFASYLEGHSKSLINELNNSENVITYLKQVLEEISKLEKEILGA